MINKDDRPRIAAPLDAAEIDSRRRKTTINSVLVVIGTAVIFWLAKHYQHLLISPGAPFQSVVFEAMMVAFILAGFSCAYTVLCSYDELRPADCESALELFQSEPELKRYRQTVIKSGRKFVRSDVLKAKRFVQKCSDWEMREERRERLEQKCKDLYDIPYECRSERRDELT